VRRDPVVVLSSERGASSVSMAAVQRRIAAAGHRTCAYDRAGLPALPPSTLRPLTHPCMWWLTVAVHGAAAARTHAQGMGGARRARCRARRSGTRPSCARSCVRPPRSRLSPVSATETEACSICIFMAKLPSGQQCLQFVRQYLNESSGLMLVDSVDADRWLYRVRW